MDRNGNRVFVAGIGVGSERYETYENLDDLDKRFRKISARILELKPKDVKSLGISKQTLWNTNAQSWHRKRDTKS